MTGVVSDAGVTAVDAGELVEAAIAQTGLEDFGPDVEAMHEGLGKLVESVNRDAALPEAGEAAFAGMIGSLLTRRLQIEDWYREHPETADQEIESVLFGLGLPRTGSTALSYLLAQDAGTRTLRQWEANQPCPPPELATERTDPRFLAAQAAVGGMSNLPSEIRSMLPMSPDGPAEDLDLLSMAFRCMALDTVARTPSYGDWLMTDCDFDPAYRYHRRVVLLLQSRRPPSRWRLKTPAHALSIDALDRVYPDAKFVITHRDVTKVIPSVASVSVAVVRMFTGNADPTYFGPHVADLWDVALRRFIAFRDRMGEARFHDIAFDDLQADPIGSVRGLYDWLGEELTPDTVAAMEEWWATNDEERAQHEPHRYDPRDFGLDPDELTERFAYYGERFPFAG